MIHGHIHIRPPTVEELELQDVIVSLKVALALGHSDVDFLSRELMAVEDKVITLQRSRGLFTAAWYESRHGYPPRVI